MFAFAGEATVGKTALSSMFESGGGTFPQQYLLVRHSLQPTRYGLQVVHLSYDVSAISWWQTVGTELRVRAVDLPDSDVKVELFIHDTGGQPIFNQREFGTGQFVGANAAILVFDVSNRETLTSCAKWLRRLQDTSHRHEIIGVLVGNKVDLAESGRRTVSEEEGKEMASALGLDYVETSAADAYNVDEPFQRIAHRFQEKYEDRMRALASAE